MNVLRLFIGAVGGYIISSLFTITLSFILPFSNKAENILAATLFSFLIWAFLILYTFKVKKIIYLIIQFSLCAGALYFTNDYFYMRIY